jgi:hypothetical protein
VSKAIREALKYTTKGEKGARDQARHAAAVEIAFRNVKRVSIGGALRNVRLGDSTGPDEDAKPEDLHAVKQLKCEGCGSHGPWEWGGNVSAEKVVANGGYRKYSAPEAATATDG